LKKLPWLSLCLLLFAYFNLGWVLYVWKSPWWVWLLVTIVGFGITEALAFPLSLFRTLFSQWIGSDTKAFFGAIILVFLTVLLLSWIDFSTHLLLLIAAATLARLELQAAAIAELQAFFCLSFFSFLGLAVGGGANWSMHHIELLVKFFQQIF
jgi:hypothetical protein